MVVAVLKITMEREEDVNRNSASQNTIVNETVIKLVFFVNLFCLVRLCVEKIISINMYMHLPTFKGF